MPEHTPTAGRPRCAARGRLFAAGAVVCAATAVYPAVMTAQAATPPLTVLYKTSTGATADEAEPWFEVVNNTATAIPYTQRSEEHTSELQSP